MRLCLSFASLFYDGADYLYMSRKINQAHSVSFCSLTKVVDFRQSRSKSPTVSSVAKAAAETLNCFAQLALFAGDLETLHFSG